MNLDFATTTYSTIRDRIRAQDPQIDEQTLADTVEGLTDLHEILAAVIRAALTDQALANGLEGRIAEMQARQDRLQDRAAKRRQIAKDVMVELDLKKLSAPDFTASIRPGTPTLMVIDEAAVPSIYWEPRQPRLKRQELALDLKGGAEVAGATLSNTGRILATGRQARLLRSVSIPMTLLLSHGRRDSMAGGRIRSRVTGRRHEVIWKLSFHPRAQSRRLLQGYSQMHLGSSQLHCQRIVQPGSTRVRSRLVSPSGCATRRI